MQRCYWAIYVTGSQEQCKHALAHIQRILVVKATVFQKDDVNRRKPRYDWSLYCGSVF